MALAFDFKNKRLDPNAPVKLHDVFSWLDRFKHLLDRIGFAEEMSDDHAQVYAELDCLARQADIAAPVAPKIATGFAIRDNGDVVVASVSPTKIGAIVNWLSTDRRILVMADTSDKTVLAAWEQHRGSAEAVEVEITVKGV